MSQTLRDSLFEFLPGFLILLPIYVLAWYFLFYKDLKLRMSRRRFFRAMKEILTLTTDPASQEKQLNLIFKNLVENIPLITSRHRSIVDFLESFIYVFDAEGPNVLKRLYNLEADRPLRDGAYNLLLHIREANPFSSLPAREANLLRVLKQAADSNNRDLADTTLRQLAESIEILDSTIKNSERKARISFIFTIVGAILTLFFGLISLVQVFTN